MRNLSSLFHGTDRLERELKRTGVLVEPPTPLSDQEQAEHDRVTALVDAHATEHEKATLDFSAMAGVGVQFGWRLTDLAAAASGEELERPLPPFEWNPSVLVEVTARIELRRELRLPRRECVLRNVPQEASYCLCLSEAIDAAIASGQPTTRDEVLKAARRAHGERWAWLKRKPKPRPEPPRTESVKARISPPPRPVPAAAVSETNTKPARVVKRTPKWFDEPGRRSIMDMKF